MRVYIILDMCKFTHISSIQRIFLNYSEAYAYKIRTGFPIMEEWDTEDPTIKFIYYFDCATMRHVKRSKIAYIDLRPKNYWQGKQD